MHLLSIRIAIVSRVTLRYIAVCALVGMDSFGQRAAMGGLAGHGEELEPELAARVEELERKIAAGEF